LYLKEIQLENFKSFGRKIKIPFLQGFTAITGPNGSGKSNISDAILFVLGPKSPRVIRAGKLTDLIFNGGKDKKPSKYTKVTLLFDNKDRAIPFDADEVALTRLVKISPTHPDKYLSYFYVNGKTSNLTYFEMLLQGARISAEGYNIVQQGDINKIITMGNLERRRIFDTLAGITHYDEDIHKAKLEQGEAERNIEKVDLILKELESDLRKLKKERNEALKYKEMKDLKDSCAVKMEYKKRHEMNVEFGAAIESLRKLEEDDAALKAQKEDTKREQAVKEKELTKIDAEIAKRGGEEAKKLQEQINSLKLDHFKGKDAISVCLENINQGKEKAALTSVHLESGKKEKKKIEADLEQAKQASEAKKSELDKTSARLKTIEDRISKSNEHIMKLQKEDLAIRQKMESTQDTSHNLDLKEDRLAHNLEGLKLDIARLEEDIRVKQGEVKDAEFMMKSLQQEAGPKGQKPLKELQAEFQRKRNQESKLSQESRELEAILERLNREFYKMRAEKAAIESAQKGYTQGVESILQMRTSGEMSGVIGTVAELANVEKKYERALTVAAGRRMQAIVVNDDEVAAQCIAYLKKKRAGLATFLPLNKMLPGRPQAKALMASKSPDAVGFAIDLISFDERYRNAFWYIFQDTVIMKDMESARKLIGGVRMVTLDGDMIDPAGGMTGGFREESKLTFGKKQMSDFETKEEEMAKANRAAEDTSEQLRKVREELDALEKDLRERSSKEGVVGSQIDGHKAKHKEFSQRLADAIKEKDLVQGKIDAITKDLAKNAQEKAAAVAQLAELEKQRQDVRKQISDATPEKVRKEMDALKAASEELAQVLRDLRSVQDTSQEKLKIYSERLKEFEDQIKEAKAAIDSNQKRITEREVANAKIEGDLKALQIVEASLSKELRDLTDKKTAIRDRIKDLEHLADTLDTKIRTNFDIALQYKTKQSALEKTLAEAEAHIQAFAVKYSEEDVTKFPASEELQRSIQEAEAKMEALGAVNMRAIDDYNIKDQRKTELDDEKAKLLEHRENLIKLVENFVTRKKEGLMEVFGAVSINFGKIYEELTSGGDAKLVLENPEDPFQAGLTIEARPSGKKVLRIEALSGGEKGVASMALIFAIQQFMPSPFYLLDEIDQNLDAINAENISRMVKKNSAIAQFVVISLHKVTLKEADHVYGVTIQKDGITDIIGNVNISEVKDYQDLSKRPGGPGPAGDGGDMPEEPVEEDDDGGGEGDKPGAEDEGIPEEELNVAQKKQDEGTMKQTAKAG